MAAQHVILVGGGHTHALVLAALARRPAPTLRLTLVSPERWATYSGMVPGVIAGQYRTRQAQIDLEALAARTSAVLLAAAAVNVDASRRTIELSDGSQHPYDLLSFDIGSQAAPVGAIDPAAPLVALRPIDTAIARLDAALAAASGGLRVVVVGAGAAGTEVACALRARLRERPASSVTLCDEAARPLATRAVRTSRLVERACAQLGIRFVGNAPVERVDAGGVQVRGGSLLPAELVVWAAGAGARPLFRRAGLAVDASGYLLVGADLRCTGHPEIFAAGDCATLTTHPSLPKAGVYAVRQAPVLAHNLAAATRGEPLRRYTPQPRFLALLNTADGRAIASYGPLAVHQRWAWRLKDWIDRRFIARLDPHAQ
jgi:pyridine nucleotide-disulfide oxidoreductase family protein